MAVTRGASLRETAGKWDPLDALGPDVFRCVLRCLDAQSLHQAESVSQGWRLCAQQGDAQLWRPHCEAAWKALVYVPAAQRADLTWRQRFCLTHEDARRTTITTEELCAFCWKFRFKPAAGEYWMGLDPFWTRQGPQMQRLFAPDGSVTAPPGDLLWGEHECRWRFCKTREGVRGHFVKINHWPSLDCSRTTEGGWRMQNMWVVYEAVLPPGGPYSRGLGPGLAHHLG